MTAYTSRQSSLPKVPKLWGGNPGPKILGDIVLEVVIILTDFF